MNTVSASDLARNTRKILDRVSSRGETVLVERNRTTVARIVPPERIMTADQALSGLRATLKPKHARDWLKDSKGTFGEGVSNPWE